MKKISTLLIMVVLTSFLFTSVASAACTTCQDASIKDLKVSPATGTAPLKVNFVGTFSGNVGRVSYQLVDSVTGKLACSCGSKCPIQMGKGTCTCSCIAPKAGTYDAVMTIYNKAGQQCCTPFVLKNAVTVTDKKVTCTPNFNFKVNRHVAVFKDTTTPKATKWSWDFGDGTKSIKQNPVHYYKKVGTYKVCLTATASCGTASTCKNVVVR